MANIAVLLPEQTIIDCAEKVISEKSIEVPIIKYVNNETAVPEARAAIDAGCQIIVARGNQAMQIAEQTDAAVIEVRVSTLEIGIMVSKAKKMLHKDNPIIGFIVFPNMVSRTDYVEELFGFQMQMYPMQQLTDADELIQNAIDNGVDLVIGGINVVQAAMERGFPCQYMETRETAIRHALDVAEKVKVILDAERNSQIQMETIFDASFNGIIKINAHREIVAINHVMESLIGKKASEVIGVSLEQALPGIDEESLIGMLGERSEIYSSSLTIRGSLLMVMGAPIQYGDTYIGAILTFHKVISMDRLNREGARENATSDAYGYQPQHTFDAIVRKSQAIRACIAQAKLYALSNNPVLIYGETGTEKTLLAESIHSNSRWNGGPFYHVDCASMTIAEQREYLFGTKKDEEGIFQRAANGTVYLQAIERISMENQRILMQFIQNRKHWRSGVFVHSNMRIKIIVSTTQDLYELVQHGHFCQELYYLLAGQTIRLPALRTTTEDIPILVNQYVQQYEAQYSRYMEISDEAMKVLSSYPWKGNLLQLEGFCEHMILTVHKRRADEGIVRYLLSEMYPPEDAAPEISPVRLLDPQAQNLQDLLHRFHGDKRLVAEELHISPTTVWRRMKKYGIIYGNKS